MFSVLIFCVALVSKSWCQIFEEKQLHAKLLKGYNIDVRPCDHKKFHVQFEMRLQKLEAIDVKAQIMTIRAFTMLCWRDPQLDWNVSYYKDIKRVTVNSGSIWTPDRSLQYRVLTTVANNNKCIFSADDQSYHHTDLYKTKVFIKNTGDVIWNAPIMWRVSCDMTVKWFPIDEQRCNLSFGSWSYSSSQLKLEFRNKPKSKASVFSSQFLVNSGEWSIKQLNAYEGITSFDCCPDAFSTVTCELIVKRESLYYFMYIILPLVALSFLFMMIFHIPPETGERMGFGVTILLSITVYLLVLSEKLPEKYDELPMLAICFILMFFWLCIGLMCACVTAVVSLRTTKPPECLVHFIMDRKCLIFCCSCKPNKHMRNKEYNKCWQAIRRYIDMRLYVIFNLVLLIAPTIGIVAL